jgi:hypothetical protein
MKRILLTIFTATAAVIGGAAQNHDDMEGCPMHQQHQAGASHNDQDLTHRGNPGMGFDQDKTTHHFILSKDGGAIQVTANSGQDQASIDQIRVHLRHIEHAFHSGDFNIPMFVHDQTPPGVPAMTRLKDQLQYKYEAMESGGRVLISSKNAEAVAAVHEFLRFQINEHKTGDALDVK